MKKGTYMNNSISTNLITDKMNQFFKRCNVSKLNLNRPVSNKLNQYNNLSEEKAPGPNGFTGEFF